MADIGVSPADMNGKRLWVKSLQLRQIQQQLTYVDYNQAQRDCEKLAADLGTLFSRRELAAFRFVAIPRGGFIVLGMLAYLLDLKAQQLQSNAVAPTAPLCIVDDCSLTGLRLAEMLDAYPNPHVVFAHLYSHPALRKAILQTEHRVRHCVAARDLQTLAGYPDAEPEDVGGAGGEKLRIGSQKYWSGSAAPVAFAWSEPDIHVRDAFTRQVEHHWRFVAPHLCLENRMALAVPLRPASSPIAWRVPSTVVTGWMDGELWLFQTDTTRAYVLQDLQADAWRALAAYGTADAALDFLRTRFRGDHPSLQQEIEAIIDYLDAEKLIERAD